jgi:hypothetical protein
MPDRSENPILTALTSVSIVATIVNMVMCFRSGVGETFLSIAEDFGTVPAILWFSISVLLLFVVFMTAVEFSFKLLFMSVDRLKARKAAASR